MIITHYTDSDGGANIYYAEFMFNGNGYNIFAENISKEGFAKALAALVT